MPTGRGIAPRIRGIVEVPEPDQAFFISRKLAPDILANLFRRARRLPKPDVIHLAAEMIVAILHVTPEESSLDGSIREQGSRVGVGASLKVPLR